MAQRRNRPVLSFTTGAPLALYTADGFFGNTIEEYLILFETTARLCNLELLAPFYTCGVSYADRILQNLGMDFIDLYIYHIWDYSTPVIEVLEALHAAVTAGKVRAIGISNLEEAYQPHVLTGIMAQNTPQTKAAKQVWTR